MIKTDISSHLSKAELRRIEWLMNDTACGDKVNGYGEYTHPISESDDELLQRYFTAQCSEIREQGGGQATNGARTAGIDGLTNTAREEKPCSGCKQPFVHEGPRNHYCLECLKKRPETWGQPAGIGGTRHVIHKEYRD